MNMQRPTVGENAMPDARVPGYLGRILTEDGAPVGSCFQLVPGVLVTAWHVLADVSAAMPGATVLLDPLAGGARLSASVTCLDPEHDLAVLVSSDGGLSEVSGPLAASDGVAFREEVRITGHAEVYDPGHAYRYLDAPGNWMGGSTRDNEIRLGRMVSAHAVTGMSGAPVVRDSDGAVVGVVSGRYNTPDGWLAGTVWVSRTEDLAPLLTGLADVDLSGAPGLFAQSPGGEQPPSDSHAAALAGYLRWVADTHRGARALIADHAVDAPLARMPWTGSVHSDGSTAYGRDQELEYLWAGIRDRGVPESEVLTATGVRTEALADRPLPTYVGPAVHPDVVDPSAPRGSESEPATEFARATWRGVILGDPGSGKTTIVRRIALEHALRGLAGEDSVWRLPVLCRAADLVPVLSQTASDRRAIVAAAATVGWAIPGKPMAPADPHSGDRIPPAVLAGIALQAATQGRLLLIVDGLDEVATVEQRGWLVSRLNELIAAEGERYGLPERVRGNQILVTSRLIGYHATPMAGPVRQVMLERMTPEESLATGQFWLEHFALAAREGPAGAAAAREQLGRLLDPHRAADGTRSLTRLVANPYLLVSLVSAIASGALAGRAPGRPVARGDLYEFMIGDALRRGTVRFPGVPGGFLLGLHAALSYVIHRTTQRGILAPGALTERTGDALAMLAAEPAVPRPSAGTDVGDAVRYVTELGLLADRGQELYGFLHLTLEEYLAGRWLVLPRTPADTAARIRPHLGDPRWVEPIRLGLGYLSRVDPRRLDETLTALLALAPGEQAIGLLTGCIADLGTVSAEHVEATAMAVLAIEAERLRSGAAPASAARALLPLLSVQLSRDRGDQRQDGARRDQPRAADVVSRVVAAALDTESPWQVAAAARVAQALRLHDHRVVAALIRAQYRDDSRYGWAVVRALQAICVLADETLRGVDPEQERGIAAARDSLADRPELAECEVVPGSTVGVPLPARSPIPDSLVPFRAAVDDMVLARLATGPAALLRLVYCLFGGTVFTDARRWRAEKARLDSVLAVTDTARDTARAAAVQLDTVVVPAIQGNHYAARAPGSKDNRLVWPAHITVDSPMTQQVIDWLRGGASPDAIAAQLRAMVADSTLTADLRGDAAASLIVLGAGPAADTVASVLPALPERARERLTWRLERARFLLADETARVNIGAVVTSLFWAEPEPTWDDMAELYTAAVRALIAGDSDWLPSGGGFMWRVNVQEAFVSAICGSTGTNTGDQDYSIAVLLDTTGGLLAHDGAQGIAEMLATAHLAATAYEGHVTDWDLDSLAPRSAPSLPEALTAVSGLVPRLAFVRCWLLDRMIPLLVAEDYAVEGICLALRDLASDPVSVLRTVRRFAAALPALAPLTEGPDEEVGGPVLLTALGELAGKIGAPYPRARAQARLAALRAGLVDREALLRSADAIADPHDRLRFLELAASLSLLRWDQAVTVRVRTAVAAMPSALDAALAVTRLARSVSPRDFHRLRQQLTEIARQEPTERVRLRSALGGRAALADPLLRFDPLMTTLDMHNETDLCGWRGWAALTTAALSDDALAALRPGSSGEPDDSEPDEDELWEALADPARHHAAVDALRHRSPRRLDLDAAACATVSRMLRAGEVDLVADVLTVARLRRPLAEVTSWRATANARVADLATLLVIEAGDLDEAAVEALPRLLEDPDDLVRIRASLASCVVSRGGPRPPAHRASRIGARALAEVVRRVSEPLTPRTSTYLWWVLTDVEHDSGETLTAALGLLAAQPRQRVRLLGSVRQLTEPVLPVLAGLAAGADEQEQLAVLDALEGIAADPERAGLRRDLSAAGPPLRALTVGTADRVQARAWSLLGQVEPASDKLLQELTLLAAQGTGVHYPSGAILGAAEGLGHLLLRMGAVTRPENQGRGSRWEAVRALRGLATGTDAELAVIAAAALFRAGEPEFLFAELAARRVDAFILLAGTTELLDAMTYIGPAYYQLASAASAFVREPPGLSGTDAEQHTRRLLREIIERSAEELRSVQQDWVRRRDRPRHRPGLASLLSVLADVAQAQPAQLRVAARAHPDLGSGLARAVMVSDSWVVRRQAALLLILLGHGDAESVRALLDTALDTDAVRQPVLTELVWFDSIKPDGFALLLAATLDPKPGRSYLAVQLLAVLAARSVLPDAEHQAALAAIQRAMTGPGAAQPLLAEHFGQIRNMGSVAEAARQLLADLAAGGRPVTEAFGAPQFRLRLPAAGGTMLEFVVPRYPVGGNSPLTSQADYYLRFEDRSIRDGLTEVIDAAAGAASVAGIPLDELLAGSVPVDGG
jgi:hypothetical protein